MGRRTWRDACAEVAASLGGPGKGGAGPAAASTQGSNRRWTTRRDSEARTPVYTQGVPCVDASRLRTEHAPVDSTHGARRREHFAERSEVPAG
jgi:hypothetical protein